MGIIWEELEEGTDMTKIYYMEKLLEIKIMKILQKKFCVRDLTSLLFYKHCFFLPVLELFIQGRL